MYTSAESTMIVTAPLASTVTTAAASLGERSPIRWPMRARPHDRDSRAWEVESSAAAKDCTADSYRLDSNDAAAASKLDTMGAMAALHGAKSAATS